MSAFEVKIVRIDEVTDHPNADRLSLNRIGGFIAVSNKEVSHAQGESQVDFVHRYQTGQLVVYVPEGAVVPLDVLEQYGYTDADGKGILAGSKGNRVKAIKLRGVVSQGLIFPLGVNGRLGDWDVKEGMDVAHILGITKYEPVIPASMSGDVVYYPSLTLKFDLENQQKYPDVFEDDDCVYVTEKLHGTFAGFVFVDRYFVDANVIDPADLIEYSPGRYATAYSKGLGGQGLVFKATPQNIERNLYLRVLNNMLQNPDFVNEINMHVDYVSTRVTLLGEVYGKGVQDLDYSMQGPAFAAFNIVADDKYMHARGFFGDPTSSLVVPLPTSFATVPLVYQGPYKTVIDNLPQYRDGKSLIDGMTLREGIVVVPAIESRNHLIGRKALKIVSPDYLLRKNGTEYN